jgi:GTP cyclohydrolase FolE2
LDPHYQQYHQTYKKKDPLNKDIENTTVPDFVKWLAYKVKRLVEERMTDQGLGDKRYFVEDCTRKIKFSASARVVTEHIKYQINNNSMLRDLKGIK